MSSGLRLRHTQLLLRAGVRTPLEPVECRGGDAWAIWPMDALKFRGVSAIFMLIVRMVSGG